MLMRFIRSFHSVGQGAFYSERICFDDKQDFIAVYDCGSKSLGSDISIEPKDNVQLGKIIKSDLPRLDVDILFISHFDMDHVNGCKFLNPKVVIIPFIPKDQIIVYQILNKLGKGNFAIEFMKNPQSVFGNSRIIAVQPAEEDNELSGAASYIVGEGADFPSDSIRSGSIVTVLPPNKTAAIWEYIVYNPNLNKFFNNFKSEVEKKYDWAKLSSDQNGIYIMSILKDLTTIFNKLNNKNQHSLQVYSGSKDGVWEKYMNFQPLIIPHCPFCIRYHHFCDIGNGCLYFGDISVKSNWLDNYYKLLDQGGKLEKVSTIQIPHHGSISSHGDLCVEDRIKNDDKSILCIISVGEKNTYGHPSLFVINELEFKGSKVFCVTDRSITAFTETCFSRD